LILLEVRTNHEQAGPSLGRTANPGGKQKPSGLSPDPLFR